MQESPNPKSRKYMTHYRKPMISGEKQPKARPGTVRSNWRIFETAKKFWTVSRFFSELNVPVIDADEISRELTAAGTEYHQKIIDKIAEITETALLPLLVLFLLPAIIRRGKKNG